MPDEGPASKSLLSVAKQDVDGAPSPGMMVWVAVTTNWYYIIERRNAEECSGIGSLSSFIATAA